MRDIEKYLILKTFLIFCRFNHSMKPIISQTASYDMLLIGADKLMNSPTMKPFQIFLVQKSFAPRTGTGTN